jgi:hypothetical protein
MGMRDVRGRSKREWEYPDSIHVRSCPPHVLDQDGRPLAYCCQLAAFRGSYRIAEISGNFRAVSHERLHLQLIRGIPVTRRWTTMKKSQDG